MNNLILSQIIDLSTQIDDLKFKLETLHKLAAITDKNNRHFWINISEELGQTEPRKNDAVDPVNLDSANAPYYDGPVRYSVTNHSNRNLHPVLRVSCFYSSMESIIEKVLSGELSPSEIAAAKRCDKCNCEMQNLKNYVRDSEMTSPGAPAVGFNQPKKVPVLSVAQKYKATQKHIKSAAMLSLLFEPADVLRICSILMPALLEKIDNLDRERKALSKLLF